RTQTATERSPMARKWPRLPLVAAVASGTALAVLPVPLIALPSVPFALAPVVHAPAAAGCGSEAALPGNLVVPVPWQQKWLDPERVWPLATGAGQVVAVIDTGVDGTHPPPRRPLPPGVDHPPGPPD